MEPLKVECPKCERLVLTLFRPNIKHPGPNLCSNCNRKRIKEEKGGTI